MEVLHGEVRAVEFFGNLFPGKSTYFLIGGKAGVGKTSLAHILRAMLLDDSRFERVIICPFATGVKNAARDFFGWDGEKDEKGRKLLQDIGQIGRNYNENVWINYALDIVNSGLFKPEVILADDWRFKNELDQIVDTNLFNVYSIRVVAPNRETLKGTPQYHDVSENSLPEDSSYYDFVVDNEKEGLKFLAEKAKDILNIIL